MYQKVDTNLNFVDREKQVEKFWKENHIFEKSMEDRKDDPTYMFYDGPPTANGKPHIGHVLTRVIKDMIPRYRTMKGYMVPRKAGWDTHGLPVELEVEKKLGLDGKEQIEEYGMEPFIQQCKESVWKYKGMWEDFSSTVGFWADMENPYVTYHDDYIESEWWALKEIWNKKLLYKGFKIVPYCPRCGTPLSAQEVSQGYKTVKERSAIVRFKVVGEDAYFLAWTTTPWTLPSNVALCVNPTEVYCKVKAADGYTYYMAEALLDKVLGKLGSEETPAYEVLEKYVGKDLEYKEYEPLFACAGEAAAKQKKKAHFVTADNYVTMSDGTGIVHIAPAFGEDDSRVGRDYDLPFVQFVDGKGDMTAETPYAGVFVKKADPLVLQDLDKEGKLFDAPKFEHDYPHCWRCDTPLIYYARESWFIKMTAVKDDLIRNNNTINWIPESIGKGRFGDWLENVQDWGISRNRYWGTPLNIWQCECGHMHSIGSRQELFEMSGDEKAKTVELHRPYIDEITLKCPECGGTMHRVPEVIDCWFDSGAMPFAQHHYPFENKELFEKQFPADFISEAVDQTRGWFYSLLAESTILFNQAPYKNVIVLGHVQDENGQKMSKSKGNAVDPFDALEKYGADAIRWYFYINSAPWLPNRFHGKAVQEGQRKFMGTLWNTYAFFVLYANIDNFDPTKYTLDYDNLPVMDKWLLSKLNSVVKTVDDCLANYKIPESARALQEFVDEMSNWYVRRSRERFWAKGMEQDKINAYMTLYHALVTIAKTAAPMIPFMTEDIYQNLVRSIDKNAPESIHMLDWGYDESKIDSDLEQKMDVVREVIEASARARDIARYKLRWPVSDITIVSQDEDVLKAIEELQDIIKDQSNTKEVLTAAEFENLSFNAKPNLKTLGPRLKGDMGIVKKYLEEADGNLIKNELDDTGKFTVEADGKSFELDDGDILFDTELPDDFVSSEFEFGNVFVNTNVTTEIKQEAMARELIRRVQDMRKDLDLDVEANIDAVVSTSSEFKELILPQSEFIVNEIRARSLITSDGKECLDGEDVYTKDWDIEGEDVCISIRLMQ